MTLYLVIRRPCLPEDEGRRLQVGVYDTEEEARTWIADQKGEYFGPGSYYVRKVPE